jgi:hypothetical protein
VITALSMTRRHDPRGRAWPGKRNDRSAYVRACPERVGKYLGLPNPDEACTIATCSGKHAGQTSYSGGRSSVGRVQDCDSCCRGFEPHRSPHKIRSKINMLKMLASAGIFYLEDQIPFFGRSFLVILLWVFRDPSGDPQIKARHALSRSHAKSLLGSPRR